MTWRGVLGALAWIVPGIYVLAVLASIVCIVARVDDELSWIPLAALGCPWSLILLSLSSRLPGPINIVLLVLAAAMNAGALYWIFRGFARLAGTRSPDLSQGSSGSHDSA